MKLGLQWIILPLTIVTPCFSALPKVILDTDIARINETGHSDSDIDDLGALTLLNALADQGYCEILAIVTSTRSDSVVGLINAINTYYNNEEVPIGIKGGANDLIEDQDSYAKLITSRFNHSKTSNKAPSSTELLREVLSKVSAVDTVIYIHGDIIAHWEYLSFDQFWESPPDERSPLSGWEMVNEKIDEFIIYLPCLPNDGVSQNCADWSDIPSSNPRMLRSFLSTFQNTLTGNTTAPEEAHVPTGLWNTSDQNPVKVAYEYYYSETPPPWRSSNEIPDSISLYGDPLGIFFRLVNPDTTHLFREKNQGGFYMDPEDKIRWRSEPHSQTMRYFFTDPNSRDPLTKKLDDLMTYQPASPPETK